MIDKTLLWRKLNLSQANSLSRNQLLDCWDKLVTDYTKRRLTNQFDRLAAISGIALRIQPLLLCAYYAGIWESDIFGLLWYSGMLERRTERLYQPRLLESLIENYPPSDMPSWSWASSEKPVRFLIHHGDTFRSERDEYRMRDIRNRVIPLEVRRRDCIIFGEIERQLSISTGGLMIKLKAPSMLSDEFEKLSRGINRHGIAIDPDSDWRGCVQSKQWNQRDEANPPHFVILGKRNRAAR